MTAWVGITHNLGSMLLLWPTKLQIKLSSFMMLVMFSTSLRLRECFVELLQRRGPSRNCGMRSERYTKYIDSGTTFLITIGRISLPMNRLDVL